jgi:hypothetical protein
MSYPKPSLTSTAPQCYEISPAGSTPASVRPGDFILAHRKGFASWAIRTGERIRYGKGANWSHAAFCETGDTVIEALTKGVARNPLSTYHGVEYALVHTGLYGDDQQQAIAFARSCVGQEYGFLIDLGIALRFLTPGRGLWFGASGTEICSGLVAQAMTRGWMIFDENPASISPSELAIAYGVTR